MFSDFSPKQDISADYFIPSHEQTSPTIPRQHTAITHNPKEEP